MAKPQPTVPLKVVTRLLELQQLLSELEWNREAHDELHALKKEWGIFPYFENGTDVIGEIKVFLPSTDSTTAK